MTDATAAVAAFVTVELDQWQGLPADLTREELVRLLGVDVEAVTRGELGNPAHTGEWAAAEASAYRGGIRVWADPGDGRVLLLEGLDPVDEAGEPLPAPDLGVPDAMLDAVLGPFHVARGERVYGARGLALRVNPDNGVLVGVVGFAPTDADDYRRRLQPHRQPTMPLPKAVTR